MRQERTKLGFVRVRREAQDSWQCRVRFNEWFFAHLSLSGLWRDRERKLFMFRLSCFHFLLVRIQQRVHWVGWGAFNMTERVEAGLCCPLKT